ncbi:crotonase/enoyl-CoA hydratase family protein [Parasphingopyxis marina]|uniref:Crotonase/enoyl-CoA hydratase family protein n=1 Tax=Parasphingopyxis marina TaxID=2761622 RepID=A0A842I146_9SPHN|nr:crotonase/enoyl-CoA hydratase family protein [Parasphingopyxis marina]MBC2778451.1 crotonase/enoyl-CoA hydratase family protein [Parasphingopyxis marina]
MTVGFETHGAVLVVSIEHPERRNAVDSATAALLYDAFQRFEADAALHVAILTGSGGHFCAGADLKALSEGDRRPISDSGRGPMGPARMRLSKPVIAAIEGYAVAGGMELALWCDLRVMARSAKMGVFCRRFGVPLVDMGAIRLPRLIGQSRATDLILTGREVDAEEALAIGLANRVAGEGEALEAALALAQDIAAFPQLCLRNDRAVMLDQWALSEEDAIRLEARLGRETVSSGETLSGAAAFAGGKGRHGAF